MPLTMLRNGESSLITHIGGKDETKKFLENLGFVVGTPVTVVSEINGNLIVHIMDSRVAISREMAAKIFV
ncbi:MAG: ferrous iron transport protein A [Oscillospiraceae bacterium]|nr:ferrous iron transport protein A [Oscillospiraceae bacterium]